ncbi:hypothetical protein Ae201684P_022464 [Aphanomyces euteiches]|nr:hypothetical protein Ae201684P_022464 [Aphanomyces euteiches]
MANMSTQFLCNMTFTPIIPGAAPATAAPAKQYTNGDSATAQTTSGMRYNNIPYYNDCRNADYSYHDRGRGGRGGSRRPSQSRQNDRGRRQYSAARRSNRDPRPPQHGWGDLAPQTAGGHDAIQHGGWLVPIVPQARQNVDVAAPIDVSQIDAEEAPPQNLNGTQPASVEVIDLVSPESVAVAEPIEALQPVDVQAPLEVEEASEAQKPLDAPQTDIGEAQPDALDTADAQPRAEDPEVGAQAPVEVAKDVDVNAQEVAVAQATANVNLVAGDDDDAAAPLDAAGPTQ